MHRTKRKRTATMVALLLLAVAPPAVRAQQPLPIYVSFDFSDPMVTGRITSTRAAHETEVAQKLAGKLWSQWPYWTFRTGGAGDFPQLRLKLERHGDEWKLTAGLFPLQNLGETGHWSFVLYPDGEIARRGLPGITLMKDDIEKALGEFLVLPESLPMFEKLAESAPIAREVALISVVSGTSRALAVIPLQWDKYCNLGSSEFAIDARWSQGGRVTIVSRGTGSWAGFKPQDPQPYPAVQVEFVKWIAGSGAEESMSQHLQHLAQLTPLLVRLKKFTLDLVSCEGTSGAAPSVAQ